MIEGLNPYPRIKVSGVPCLGVVPEHWEVLPLKHWVRMNRAVLPETTAPNHEFLYLDIGSVGTGILTAKPQHMSFAAAPSRARRIIGHGDTIISTVRTYLKAVYFVECISQELVCSTGFAVLTPSANTVPKFVSYLCQSSPFTDRVTADSVGIAYPAIDETTLGRFHVPVPSLPEQATIVRFLDHADRKIRRYIRAKQKLIKLLEEQKQAIIHRAVTRGLDPSVPLKDSGVPWLGEIPAHWALLPNRAFLRVRKNLVGDRHPTFTLLSLTKRGVIVRDLSGMRGKFSSDMGTSQEVRPGDLVFCLFDVRETPRTIGLSEHAGIITGAYTVMECTRPDIAAFLELFYIAMDDRKLLSPLYSGLRHTIPKERFLGAKTPIPPAGEMAAILKAVEGRTESLVTTISGLIASSPSYANTAPA